MPPKIDGEDHPFGNRSWVNVDLATLHEAAESLVGETERSGGSFSEIEIDLARRRGGLRYTDTTGRLLARR